MLVKAGRWFMQQIMSTYGPFANSPLIAKRSQKRALVSQMGTDWIGLRFDASVTIERYAQNR